MDLADAFIQIDVYHIQVIKPMTLVMEAQCL